MPKQNLKPRRPKRHAARATPARSSPASRARVPLAGTAPAEKPHWNAADHTFTWRGQIVKHFKAAAPFQEAILAAFELAGWPSCILLERVAFKGLDGKNRLQNTVANLTFTVHPYLRFRLEGNGTRIRWEPR